MQRWIDYNNGVYAFCANYVRPLLAAIHLVVEKGRVALVDTGSNDALPHVLDALRRLGLGPEAVDYVILTHIHLDHAGGAGCLMQACPNARLVVHPRGARHMAAPARLVDGVTAVYGADYVKRVYGDIVPVPAARIINAVDGLTLDLAGRELLCLDAPGHARHHIAIVDRQSRGIFTGDVFGLSYREMDTAGRPFIFPSTTPTQFEPDAMVATIDRLLGYQPESLYLTHYSRVGDVPALAREVKRFIAAHCDIALANREAGTERHARIVAGLQKLLLEESRAFGCVLPDADLLALWETDLELNAQGLEVWLDLEARGYTPRQD